MSWNHLPVWDKNSPIYFKIGMIISLAIINIAINYESLLPNYSDFVFTDDPMNLLVMEVKNHTEPSEPKQPVTIRKAHQFNANIVTTDQTVIDRTETISDNTDIDVHPTNTNNTGTGESDAVLPDKKDVVSTPTLLISEQMPYLTTCESNVSEDNRRKCTQSTMLATIYKYLKYPAIARETGVQGTVIITFIIDKNGKMTQLEIIRDIGAGCGYEAVKVIKSLGEWIPGRHNKQAVNVKYTIPIRFKLS
jgi:protein TonB